MRKLSIIIPVYNEEKTLKKVLEKVDKTDLGLTKEIIIVDDGSKDGSKQIIEEFLKNKKKGYKFISKENGGKGSAVGKGVERATGDLIIMQDADLEYNPEEIKKLLEFQEKSKFEVVYGSRISNHKNSYHYFSYYLGNIFVTMFTNLLYNTKLTDMETCYKLIPKEIMKKIKLESNGFDMEPEITAKILRMGYKIGEIPITYKPRTKEEGKKINWKDGVRALVVLLKFRFIK